MDRAVTSNRQQRLAEQVVSYGAEQRRLKAAAASRRAAVVWCAAGEEADHSLPARSRRPSGAAARSEQLR